MQILSPPKISNLRPETLSISVFACDFQSAGIQTWPHFRTLPHASFYLREIRMGICEMSGDTGTKFPILRFPVLTSASPLRCSALGSGFTQHVAELTVTVPNMILKHAVKQNTKTYGTCAYTGNQDSCTQLIRSTYVVSHTC